MLYSSSEFPMSTFYLWVQDNFSRIHNFLQTGLGQLPFQILKGLAHILPLKIPYFHKAMHLGLPVWFCCRFLSRADVYPMAWEKAMAREKVLGRCEGQVAMSLHLSESRRNGPSGQPALLPCVRFEAGSNILLHL